MSANPKLLIHPPPLGNHKSVRYHTDFYKVTRKGSMAPHSTTLAWKIPWTEEPGGLQSMRSLRVRHDWATSLSLFTFMHWRRNWQPIPVFFPGESQGRRSLVGCHLWGCRESDTTEATQQQQQQQERIGKTLESLMLVNKSKEIQNL